MFLLKSLVLPHPHIKKRSRLLQHKALIGYILFLALMIIFSYLITIAMPNVLGYAEDISVSELLSGTNSMRADRGLEPLKLNTELSKAAEAKARDMFEKDYWDHTSPDGKEPWDFIIASGYDYLYAGENLAVDFNSSGSVVQAWYDSPSHRENLLNNNYSEIGFAVVNGELEGRKTTLVVQMFGYPRNRVASASSTSTSNPELEVYEISAEETVPLAEMIPENSLEVESPAVNVIENSNEPVFVNAPPEGAVLNSSEVFNASRFIAILLGLFLTGLFAIDGYYVRKIGVFRMSGHTILHIIMLIGAVLAIWYTQVGLVL